MYLFLEKAALAAQPTALPNIQTNGSSRTKAKAGRYVLYLQISNM
jgi:hypothetical protein